MTIGVWVLGDQLWAEQSALASCANEQSHSQVIFIESLRHAQELPYHLQKLVLVWSAMRHFAQELEQAGWSVTYKIAEDFHSPLIEWIEQNKITELRVMSPSDRPFAKLIANLNLPCPVTFTPNNRFIWSDEDFNSWASKCELLVVIGFYQKDKAVLLVCLWLRSNHLRR